MLFGPDDLHESREDIKDFSFLSVGVKKKVFVFELGGDAVMKIWYQSLPFQLCCKY